MQCEIIQGRLILMKRIRKYSELIKLNSFEDRFKYLILNSKVGIETFGFDRYLNQMFYRSKEWKEVRNFVILRDEGFDLGDRDYPINGLVIVHHMNPIYESDIVHSNPDLLDPEYLISVSMATHNAIHYGDLDYIESLKIVERSEGDTRLW